MTLEDEADALKLAGAVMDRLREDGRDMLWELRNGVVIRCKSIPQSYFQALAEALPRPTPPKVWIENKQREEENPDDPAYARGLEEHQTKLEMASLKLAIGMGTTLESCPDGMHRPESDDWIAEVQRASKFTGKTIPLELDDTDLRYVSWLRFYAVDNETDLTMLGFLPQNLGGIREGELASAVEAFRDYATRRANQSAPSPDPSQNGHIDNRSARRGRRRV